MKIIGGIIGGCVLVLLVSTLVWKWLTSEWILEKAFGWVTIISFGICVIFTVWNLVKE